MPTTSAIAMVCTASCGRRRTSARTQQIIDELQVDLIYVGQLERYLHPDGVAKFEQMAADGMLRVVYQNERVTIYATPGYRGAENVPGTLGKDAG